MKRWDVAVLGGGPAGCATALALSRHIDVRVCLVACSRPGRAAVGETIPPDSRIPLYRLGVWQRFRADGHEPCLGSCSTWGSDAVGYNDFLLNPYGNAWHLDRARFDASLLDAVASAGVTVLNNRFRCAARSTTDGFALRLTNRPTLMTARWVVDATGSASTFARGQGARRTVSDRLVFVYGFFDASPTASVTRLTMVEAVETGWWYAAGVPGRRVAVAFATDPATVSGRGLTDPDRWLAALGATDLLRDRLDGCALRPPALAVRPAQSSLLEPIAGDGWLAVGDAASLYDPISSQGIHKALCDGIEAAEAVAAALGGDRDAISAYATRVAERFDAYRRVRDHLYEGEGRWPDASFWARRRPRRAAAETAH